MKRIVTIGSPCAGKSTFARELGRVLDIEVLHLDHHFFGPNWKEYSRAERIAIQQKLVEGKDRWIMEGTYIGSLESRISNADTIIFLDMPCWLCFRQAIIRYLAYYFAHQKKSRTDMPKGCRERLRMSFLLKILAFPSKNRKIILNLRDDLAKTFDQKAFYTFRSHAQTAQFLQNLASQQSRVSCITANKELATVS